MVGPLSGTLRLHNDDDVDAAVAVAADDDDLSNYLYILEIVVYL